MGTEDTWGFCSQVLAVGRSHQHLKSEHIAVTQAHHGYWGSRPGEGVFLSSQMTSSPCCVG